MHVGGEVPSFVLISYSGRMLLVRHRSHQPDLVSEPLARPVHGAQPRVTDTRTPRLPDAVHSRSHNQETGRQGIEGEGGGQKDGAYLGVNVGFGVWRMGSVLVGSDDADGAGRQAGRPPTSRPEQLSRSRIGRKSKGGGSRGSTVR